ncbi:MAG: hypothetical protein ABGW90_10740 [Martelella sp.]
MAISWNVGVADFGAPEDAGLLSREAVQVEVMAVLVEGEEE